MPEWKAYMQWSSVIRAESRTETEQKWTNAVSLATTLVSHKAESQSLASYPNHHRVYLPPHPVPSQSWNRNPEEFGQWEIKHTAVSPSNRGKDIEARHLKPEDQHYWKEKNHTQCWCLAIYPTTTQSGWFRKQQWSIASNCWGRTRNLGPLQRLGLPLPFTFSHESRALGPKWPGHRGKTCLPREFEAF